MQETFWRRCSTCKRELGFASQYWTCSVSTCNRKGSSFVFCSMSCFNGHVPTMRHRDAWAEEQRSPTRDEWTEQRELAASAPSPSGRGAPDKEDGGEADSSSRAAESNDAAPLTAGVEREVLIVASKLKKYVRARSGMNTSDSVIDVLSDRVRALCDDAIFRAREDGRKTLMDRDF